MGMNLFGGSDSENDHECPKIEVDEEFARRYEHNKKREDLQRYEELKKSGQIPRGEDSEGSSSSEDEDDDVFLTNSKKDLKFFDALIKVRKKDPSLKNKDVKLFDSEDESDRESDEKEKEKKNKAMYLKDVVAKQLIEDGPDFDQGEEENYNNNDNNSNKLVYDDEQEKIRNAFLEAVEGDGGGGGDEVNDPVLTMKSKRKEEEAESDDDEELKKKVDEYFGDGSGGDEDENSRFLKDYFVNKMWIDKRAPLDDDEIGRISEDEEEVERQEEYEYRYQEGAGDRVLGHSREVVGTVRKRESSRREQRRHKEEREEAARAEREEELRRLKNVKRKEMESRVRRIMEIAGIEEGGRSAPLSAKELEDEFDPEEYDRMMEKAFGDEYYAADVANNDNDDDDDDDDRDDDDDDCDKPNFDAEDEELGLPKGWDGREDGCLEEEEGKKKKKLAIFEKAKEAMMDEYYKLDYEDTIGDLKTRFKYANTKGKRYGLSAAAILLMEDKELNQYVPMNKIAPYKDKEWKVPEGKRYEMKLKVNELLGRGKMDEGKSRKRGFEADKASSSSSSSLAVEEETNGEPSGLSKTAKRRKKQADLKLSTSRLMAYGKISSSKRKKKKTSR